SSELLMNRRQIAFDMRGEEATYHQFDSKHISLKKGTYSPAFTDTTIDQVLTGELDMDTIKESGGKYLKGDMAFKIKVNDLPENPPSLKSEITESNVRYRIIDYTISRDKNVVQIIGRKIKEVT